MRPREAALGLWTGREVLLIGGSDETPCPPNADCPPDPTPLADGAAVDPHTGGWRRIADVPHPFAVGQGVLVGETAYILPVATGPTTHSGLLAYSIDEDSWRSLPVPFDAAAGYGLVSAGDRLVAYLGSVESGPGKDFVLDPRTATWQPLPADPLGPSFDRAMAWTGHELVLFDHELVPNPGAEKPTVTRAATLNLANSSWRRLPDSSILSTHPWLVAGGRLVNPTLGGADGGRIGNWGATYPYGGSLDPATGRWSTLPDPPAGVTHSAGARGDSTAVYVDVAGAVFDASTGEWIGVPTAPGGKVTGRTVVAAGTAMVIFGGARPDGALINQVWVWSGET
jgi:hypothetical protein